MEPAYVEPLNLQDSEDPDDFATYEAKGKATTLSANVARAIQGLQKQIYTFKESLFHKVVNENTNHDAQDLGAMMSFHALFLQCVAYWIGGLDNTPVPAPRFKRPDLAKQFEVISTTVQSLAKTSASARTLVYQLLFRFSTQHAFDLGDVKKRNDE